MKRFISVLLMATVVLAKPGNVRDVISVDDCGSIADFDGTVEFDGCTGQPCEVFHGTTATGRIKLKATSASNTLSCKLTGIIGGIELPFDGCNVDACADLSTGACPVAPGDEIVYELQIPVNPLYPAIPVTGKWRLLDDNGDLFMCFMLDIIIKG